MNKDTSRRAPVHVRADDRSLTADHWTSRPKRNFGVMGEFG